MPTDAAWNQAQVEADRVGRHRREARAEDSIASFMVRRAASREGILRLFGAMTDPEVESLVFDLDFWARRQQIPPAGLWEVCLALAGRGFGKTWMGARWAITKAREGKTIGALIGPTAADVRDTMIRGSSGILALSPPWFMPVYEPSKRRVTWPNGVYALCYSADKPDRLRGPNTGWVWGDEPASWKHEMAALDQIPLFNRIGTKKRGRRRRC
jgi:phage terminase large subunit-like protein